MERIQEKMYRARQQRARLQAQTGADAGAGDTRGNRSPAFARALRSGHRFRVVAGVVLGVVLATFALQSGLFRRDSHSSQTMTRLTLPAAPPATVADRPAGPADGRAGLVRLERRVQELTATVSGLQASLRNLQARLDSSVGMDRQVPAVVAPQAPATLEEVSAINALPAPASDGTPPSSGTDSDHTPLTESARAEPARDGTASPAAMPGREQHPAEWVVILASLPSREAAERMVTTVRQQDIAAGHYRIRVQGKEYWRVQATGFETAAQAKSRIPQIEDKLGLKGTWVTQRTE